MYKLGSRSIKKMAFVKPRLQAVVRRAIEITECDFAVLEGMRDEERQLVLWLKKASGFNGIPKGQTKNGYAGTGVSKHQIGNAIDLGAWVSSKIDWNWAFYYQIAKAMRQASIELKTPVKWGGVWDRELHDLQGDLDDEVQEYILRRKKKGKKAFIDGPHFELV